MIGEGKSFVQSCRELLQTTVQGRCGLLYRVVMSDLGCKHFTLWHSAAPLILPAAGHFGEDSADAAFHGIRLGISLICELAKQAGCFECRVCGSASRCTSIHPCACCSPRFHAVFRCIRCCRNVSMLLLPPAPPLLPMLSCCWHPPIPLFQATTRTLIVPRSCLYTAGSAHSTTWCVPLPFSLSAA